MIYIILHLSYFYLGLPIPQYASSTFSSRQQFEKVPIDDNYLPQSFPILPKDSKVGDEIPKKIHTRKSQVSKRNNIM